MKVCELCRNGARIYCEADGASLCWDCDDKVHSANFLVAKHSRTLLCNVCHSPTQWQASGIKLGPTLSLCHICLHNYTLTKQQHKEEDQNDHDTTQLTNDDEQGTNTTDHDYSGEEDDDDDDDDDDEDGDNQVVPWSSSPPTSPPVATSSTTEDSSSVRISATATAGRGVISSLKRSRENSDFDSEDDEIGNRSTRLDQNNNASVMIMSCGALEKEEATSPSPRSLNPRRPPLALNEPYFQSYLAATP